MKQPLVKKILFGTLAVTAAGLFYFTLQKSHKILEIPAAPIHAESKNGQLVLKSFQPALPSKTGSSDERQTSAQPDFTRVQTSPTQVKIQDTEKEESVQINGQNLVWLKKTYAVKSSNGKKSEFLPFGYELVDAKESPSELGVVNDAKFNVFTDPKGLQKFVLTGSIAVESKTQKEETFFGEIAKKYNLKVSYLALQINTAFLQADNGQNLLQLQNEILKNEKDLKAVKLELLGRGVKAQ
ncbi:MAG: hypothetical protein ACXWQQ_01155 [Pseudobdellovibrio sp.]